MDWCRAAVPVVAEAGDAAKRGISASAKKVGQAATATLNATADTIDSTTRPTGRTAGTVQASQMAAARGAVNNNQRDTILTIHDPKLVIGPDSDGGAAGGNVRSPPMSNDARVNVSMHGEVSNRLESLIGQFLASRPVFMRRIQSALEGHIRKTKWRHAMRMAPSGGRKVSKKNVSPSIVLTSIGVQQQSQRAGDALSKSYSEDSRITFTEEEEEDDTISTETYSYDKTGGDKANAPRKATAGDELRVGSGASSSSNSSYTSGERKKAAAPMARYTTLESDSSFMNTRVLTLDDTQTQQQQPLVSKSSLDKLAEDWRQYRLMAGAMGEIEANQNIAHLVSTSPESTPVLEVSTTTTNAVPDVPSPSDDLLKPAQPSGNVYSATGDMLVL